MSYVRPLDELVALIVNQREAEINDFFTRYKYSQACAMALHIAALGHPQYQVCIFIIYYAQVLTRSLQEAAKIVFFKFAGKPQLLGAQTPSLTTQPTRILLGCTMQLLVLLPAYTWDLR